MAAKSKRKKSKAVAVRHSTQKTTSNLKVAKKNAPTRRAKKAVVTRDTTFALLEKVGDVVLRQVASRRAASIVFFDDDLVDARAVKDTYRPPTKPPKKSRHQPKTK